MVWAFSVRHYMKNFKQWLIALRIPLSFWVKVPWIFRLLILVFALVGGGLFLDNLAWQVGYAEAVASVEKMKDAAIGQETGIDGTRFHAEESRQTLTELAISRSQYLNDSANILYDCAKIIFGVLIASIAQISDGVRKRARNEEKEA